MGLSLHDRSTFYKDLRTMEVESQYLFILLRINNSNGEAPRDT